jgi:dihydroxyacetone kinase-like protein
MAKGIEERGKGAPGEKTMIDAWHPASLAIAAGHASGNSLAESLEAALKAATVGAESTKAMIATKGRSARLGERSLGHMDPGAASAVTIIAAIKSALA